MFSSDILSLRNTMSNAMLLGGFILSLIVHSRLEISQAKMHLLHLPYQIA